jgi:hypothetical protein
VLTRKVTYCSYVAVILLGFKMSQTRHEVHKVSEPHGKNSFLNFVRILHFETLRISQFP